MMFTSAAPTLHDRLGGIDALRLLTERFYDPVARVRVPAAVFVQKSPEHAAHVAAFGRGGT